MKKICIYHGKCADGFTSAWVVKKAHPTEDIDFYPGVYQDNPPNVAGCDVIMVDFSYKRDVLTNMAESANSILILDHHASAERDLVELPGNVTAIFDMERSGARITWDYYFPTTPVPKLILHVEDRDLWRFNIPGTRQIQAAVFSYPYEFEIWDEIVDSFDEFGDSNLRVEGAAIERKHFKDIHEFIEVAAYRDTIAGYDVPVLNAPYFFVSDAGHIMAQGEPFAACYWDTPEGRVYSLRSADDGVDVSEIAVQFGGGGHKHASGFRIDGKRG